MFAPLLRLVTIGKLQANPTAFLVIAVLATATMFVGNLLALMQTNLKRLPAYSSIAHIGYLLIPLLSGGPRGESSFAFYLVSLFRHDHCGVRRCRGSVRLTRDGRRGEYFRIPRTVLHCIRSWPG